MLSFTDRIFWTIREKTRNQNDFINYVFDLQNLQLAKDFWIDSYMRD